MYRLIIIMYHSRKFAYHILIQQKTYDNFENKILCFSGTYIFIRSTYFDDLVYSQEQLKKIIKRILNLKKY